MSRRSVVFNPSMIGPLGKTFLSTFLVISLVLLAISGCTSKTEQTLTVQPILNNQLANSYILADSGEAMVVDPFATDEIISTIKEQNLELKFIVITHGHFDHIIGIDTLKNAFPGAKILIHPKDMDKPGNSEKNLSVMFGTNVKITSPMSSIKEGDSVKLGHTIIKVLDTPGHTEGSIVLLAGNNMISGDTLFKDSVGRTDFPGSDQSDMKNSLKKIMALEDTLKVYPGHGESTILSDEKKNNSYLKSIQEE